MNNVQLFFAFIASCNVFGKQSISLDGTVHDEAGDRFIKLYRIYTMVNPFNFFVFLSDNSHYCIHRMIVLKLLILTLEMPEKNR